MKMYSLDDLNIFKKKYRLFLILFYASIVLLIAIFVVSLCFTNYKNYLYFEIFGGVLLAVFIFLSILFYSRFSDYKRYINHYTSVFLEKKTYINGILISISNHIITLDDNIRVREVCFDIDNNKATYYVLSIFNIDNVNLNNRYNVLLADHFIRSFNHEI